MVNGEDDVKIMDGQNPFLLGFEPLRLFKRPTLGTVSILSSLVVKLQRLAHRAGLHHSAHGRRAAIDDRAHGFGLLIRKPMRFFICTDMLAEDVSHIEAQRILWIFHPWLLR